MFRRTHKEDAASEAAQSSKPGGKGRPTPSRRESEAAAKERARTVLDKKAAAKQDRERRRGQQGKVREAMRTGDDRFLPARDRGPIKAFVRDLVDGRIAFLEFVLPLLIVIMLMTWSGNKTMISYGNGIWTATIVLAVIDTFLFLRRLKKALRAKFPGEDLKGTTSYALLRVLQVRFLRLPKPQVGIGGRPKLRK